jgi:hypothetical protein
MPDWENAGRGGSYDVRNTGKKIIAEIKNKHNTMNARSSLSVYDNLQRHIDYSEDKIDTAFLVEIVPKYPKPYQVPFTPSERGTRRPARNDILRIDGQSFYELATGYPDALKALYETLPYILEKILKTPSTKFKGSTFEELFKRVYISM